MNRYRIILTAQPDWGLQALLAPLQVTPAIALWGCEECEVSIASIRRYLPIAVSNWVRTLPVLMLVVQSLVWIFRTITLDPDGLKMQDLLS